MNDASVYEGATLQIPVHTDGIGPGQTLNVAYSIVHSTASADDYVAPSGSLTLVGGYGTAHGTIALPIVLENRAEGNELLTVRIDSVSMGTAGRPYPEGAGTLLPVTILDSTPIVTLSALANGSEDLDGAGQVIPVQFTVSRSGGDLTQPLSVAYQLGGSGASPADMESDIEGDASGTVTIPANATSTVLRITPTDDADVEAAQETLTATLTGGGLNAAYAYPGFAAANPNPPAPTASGAIQDNDFTIKVAKVWFDHQGLKGDDGVAYGDPWVDWNADGDAADPNEQVTPISYYRSVAGSDRYVRATTYFEVEGNFTSPTYTIKGTGTGPGGGTFEKQVTLQTSGATRYFHAEDSSDTKLPTTIDKGDLAIQWEIVRGNRADKPISYGRTSNTIYVTGAAALTEFETVVKLGCEGAKGLTPGAQDDKIVDGIWGQFSGRSVKRIDGSEMTYTHVTGTAIHFEGMLLSSTGNGQCTAWSELLVRTLERQGITASRVDIASDRNIAASQFVVNAMPAQGSGTSNYVFAGTTRATSFRFHQIVRVAAYPDRLYDPSYGATADADTSLGLSALADYENKYVSEVWNGTTWGQDTTREDLLIGSIDWSTGTLR